ncbi:hypothetical protein AYL99_11947 [Fonsecaea erecta]|uniref:Uncharacterized protein n=1 Tax=Fonsecaea erecta TaxID=1367422 RepID=A0A178Z496_9EURO|nr:hypothetical protein AYL99_11947 [Fonsecaea erecta]OAP53925.1 hypothetical protein AYL99_11947 [Fonsecaea erecta]
MTSHPEWLLQNCDECARNLETLYTVWNAHTVVVLLELHWIFSSSESKFGADVVPDLKTRYCFDTILKRLGKVSAGGTSPYAEAFGFVLMKLEIWHIYRSGQLSDDGQCPDGQTRQQRAFSIRRQNTADII